METPLPLWTNCSHVRPLSRFIYIYIYLDFRLCPLFLLLSWAPLRRICLHSYSSVFNLKQLFLHIYQISLSLSLLFWLFTVTTLWTSPCKMLLILFEIMYWTLTGLYWVTQQWTQHSNVFYHGCAEGKCSWPALSVLPSAAQDSIGLLCSSAMFLAHDHAIVKWDSQGILCI